MDPDRPAPSDVSLAVREFLQVAAETDVALARRLRLGVPDLHAVDQVLSAATPMGPAELSARLGLRSASVTALLDRLERAGHVRRAPDPADRRRITVAVTDSARQDVFAALAPLIAAIEAVAGRLDDAEAAVVSGFLRETSAAMRDFARERSIERDGR